MKLVTHNNVQSRMFDGKLLKIEAEKVHELELPFDRDYMKALLPDFDWETLVYASGALGYHELPKQLPDASILDSEEFLKKVHHALFELELMEGAMICPKTGQRFPIKRGIPNIPVSDSDDDDEDDDDDDDYDDDDEEEVPSDENLKASKRKEPPSNERSNWVPENKKAKPEPPLILPSDDASCSGEQKEITGN